MIRIGHNGSRCLGQPHASYEALLVALATHPRSCGSVDGFVDESGKRWIRAWGNFRDVSHAYQVDTDEPREAARLLEALAQGEHAPDHPCMGRGPAAAEAPRCPCYAAHFGRFPEEGDAPTPPSTIGDPVDQVVMGPLTPELAALYRPLLDAGLLRACTDPALRGCYELSGEGTTAPADPPPPVGRRDYATRKAARIDRLRARADRLRADARRLEDRARAEASVIPFGQPILVGHYSEKRDRRYRDGIHQKFMKSAAAADHAATLERRADAAEESRAISSDDPEAVQALERKLVTLETLQRRMTECNVTIRTARRHAAKTGEPWEPLAIRALVDQGLSEGRAAELVQPDFAGRVGFADYQLTNNGAEIRRCKKRIEALRASAVRAASAAPETIGEVRIEEADNRVRVYFPGKPAEDVRARLKGAGFRWAPSEGAWQRFASEAAWYHARAIARSLVP